MLLTSLSLINSYSKQKNANISYNHFNVQNGTIEILKHPVK